MFVPYRFDLAVLPAGLPIAETHTHKPRAGDWTAQNASSQSLEISLDDINDPVHWSGGRACALARQDPRSAEKTKTLAPRNIHDTASPANTSKLVAIFFTTGRTTKQKLLDLAVLNAQTDDGGATTVLTNLQRQTMNDVYTTPLVGLYGIPLTGISTK